MGLSISISAPKLKLFQRKLVTLQMHESAAVDPPTGQVINPTRVMYFSAKNYSADFSETRGIDWNLFRGYNDIPRVCGSGGNIPN